MRYLVCLVDLVGQRIADSARRRYEALPHARGLTFTWDNVIQHSGSCAVLTAWDDPWGDPLVVRENNTVAVGMVRLDNRDTIASRAANQSESACDLELIRRACLREDADKQIRGLLGDFAFVVWDDTTRMLIGATDAFAARKLYYTDSYGLLAFASRAEALARGDSYDVQHLSEFVAGCTMTPDLTVYAEVRQLPPGTLCFAHHGRLRTRTYWSPEEFSADHTLALAEQDTAHVCRNLLATSVQRRLGPSGTTWAQLSGGLDSSSIVSLAQWSAERGDVRGGLAGSVTYVDQVGTDSDERRYSDPVATRWGLRNETVVAPPLWLDGGMDLPRTDQPRNALLFFPRERRMLQIVRSAGGRVLLTGFGGDELFTGTMLFFADWVTQGRIWPALRELAHRAAVGRTSFWELMYGNVLSPLFPRAFRRCLNGGESKIRPWMASGATSRYQLRDRPSVAEGLSGPWGGKYHHATVNHLTRITSLLEPGYLGETLDVRHPFLYRPLVELALRLPPELCARPHARKWLLREAMRGLLPEIVRTRIGKGGSTERCAWSLTAQRPLLEHLVHRPILAELGVIDAARFRNAFEAAPHQPHRDDHLHTLIQSTLVIEAWLQVRSDRWPPKAFLEPGNGTIRH